MKQKHNRDTDQPSNDEYEDLVGISVSRRDQVVDLSQLALMKGEAKFFVEQLIRIASVRVLVFANFLIVQIGSLPVLGSAAVLKFDSG